MQAPTAIHIFKGPDLTIELANAPTLALWGREGDVTGKPFLEVLPELNGQGYDVMMQEVIQTKKPKSFYEVPLALERKGKTETGYFNFIYQPYYEEDWTKASGVLVFATEVTEQVLARKSVVESEAKFRALIEKAPVATCLFVGREMVIEIANEAMIQVWGKGPGVIGKPLAEALPELKGSAFSAAAG
jgi:PAS domain-containing protein